MRPRVIERIAIVAAAGLMACVPQNGKDGAAGPSGLGIAMRLDPEPAGVNCPGGGTAVRAGPDVNGDGTLQATEITTSSIVCDGADGSNGAGVIARLDPEPPGAHCSGGGAALHAGADSNQSGVLDDLEITTTTYICHVQNYTAGTGLELSDSTLSVSQSQVEDWARGACFDNATELAAALPAWDANAADDLTNTTSFGGAVTGTYASLSLASDVVTDANVSASAAISPSKIAGGAWTGANDGEGSGLDADLLDGLHGADLQRRFQRIVVVSPVVGDQLASGTALLDAVAGITGATEDDQVLVLIEPGVYDLGAATLELPMNVGLAGLNQARTMIVSASPVATISAVNADPTKVMFVLLRLLNVNNTGAANATAIYLDGASAEIRDVTVNSAFGTATTYGIWARGESLYAITNIRINVRSDSGVVAGIYCDGCTATRRLGKAYIGVFGGTDVAALRVANGGSIRFTDLDASVSAPLSTVAAGVNVVSGTAQLLGGRFDSRPGFGVVVGDGATAEVRTSEVNGSTGAVSLGSSASIVVTSSTLNGGITGPADASATLAFTNMSGAISGPGATCFAVSRAWMNSKGLNLCP